MAANLTPQYHAAEGRYRAAQTPDEQLAALEEMWRELPKHKSTEKLQAELKKKLSAARKAQQGTHRGGTVAHVDPFAIPKSGAGQVALLGPPNVGKSSLVGGLTHAHVKIAEYPFTTAVPVPGMVAFEDVQIQLVDTPPVTAEHVPTGMPGLWRGADAIVIVADLGSDALLEDVEMCLRHLTERQIALCAGPRQHPQEPGEPMRVPGLVLANKLDLPDAAANLDLLREFLAERPAVETRSSSAGGASSRPAIEPLSTRDPAALGRVSPLLYRLLHVIRVYAKPPGRKADMDEPFVLPAGATVQDMARRVYRGFEQKVHAARIWRAGASNGQNVQLDHGLHDRDVVELHT